MDVKMTNTEELDKNQKIRELYEQLTPEQKVKFISKLSPRAFNQLRYFSDATLRPKQIVPEDFTGRYFIVMAGRGFGKSKMGAAWIRKLIYKKIKGIAIVAPNYKDLEEVMIPAIINEFPPNQKPRYIGGNKGKLVAHNGIEVLCYTSEQEIRGGNFSHIWLDEICKFCDSIPEKIEERFNVLNFACRKGKAQFLITTTPKDFPIFHKWVEKFNNNDPLYQIVNGTMEENTALSIQAKAALYAEFNGTRLGRQELLGELLDSAEGALWTRDTLDKSRIDPKVFQQLLNDKRLFYNRVLVAIDPAISTNPNSDETGIMVGALGHDNHIYVLSDQSCKLPPAGWGSKAIKAFQTYQADQIIAEINQGGNMVEATLRSIDPNLPIKIVHTNRGKLIRAEPVAALHERQQIHLIGSFPELEQQLTRYNGNANSSKHDDRLDAFVYLCNELRLSAVYVNYDLTNLPHF